jgi:hypothetical protein
MANLIVVFVGGGRGGTRLFARALAGEIKINKDN